MASRPPGRRLRRWFDESTAQKRIRPRYAAYIVIVFWTLAIVVFGVVERLVDPKTFDNVWLGMWWALQTVTTVGYGDVVPQSTAGKVIASFLLLGGLSFLAVVTGAITSAFVTRAQARTRAQEGEPTAQELKRMNEQLEAIKRELSKLQRDRPGP